MNIPNSNNRKCRLHFHNLQTSPTLFLAVLLSPFSIKHGVAILYQVTNANDDRNASFSAHCMLSCTESLNSVYHIDAICANDKFSLFGDIGNI